MDTIYNGIYRQTRYTVIRNIYKFCRLNSQPDQAYVIVFRGSSDVQQVDELFDDLEITNMRLNNTDIMYSGQIVHNIDTMQTIKHKLLKELGMDNYVYETYIFMQKASNY